MRDLPKAVAQNVAFALKRYSNLQTKFFSSKFSFQTITWTQYLQNVSGVVQVKKVQKAWSPTLLASFCL